MTFWEEHEEREAVLATCQYAGPHDENCAACAQNAPTECRCGHVGTDVLLGICQACE